jgi:sugar/nucleoside kinase (ribokinase family)
MEIDLVGTLSVPGKNCEVNVKKIWCLGISNLDIITQPITHWPVFGGAVSSDTTEMHLGGMALNTAVSIAKIGTTPVGLISCLGRDFSASILKRDLEAYHIDISRLCYTDKANTGNAICFIHPGGERSFVLCMAANHYLNESNIDFDAMEEGDFLHVGGAMIMNGTRGDDLANILLRAKERNVTISLDTCWDGTGQWRKILEPCLKYVDIFETNEQEAVLYAEKENLKDALYYYSSFNIDIIVVKMGNQGALIKSNDFSGKIPIFPVDTVDATGAGDAFDAGFLIGLINGWSVEQAGVFGCAVGAKCVTAFGASSGVVSYQETLKMIKHQGREGQWNWDIK